MSTFRYISRV